MVMVQSINSQDSLKIDNMHFQPHTEMIVNPRQVGETSVKKYLQGLNPIEQPGQDTYMPQGEMAAMPMRPEQVVKQAGASAKNFLLTLAAFVIGGTMIVSGKARSLVGKIFKRKPKLKELILSTPDKLKNFVDDLLKQLKDTNIKSSDIIPTKLRLIGKDVTEAKTSFVEVNKLAREYSLSKEGVPEMLIYLKEGSEAFQKEIGSLLKEGKAGHIRKEVLERIDCIELNFIKKSKFNNDLTDINYAVRTRKIKNIETMDWLDRQWNKFINLFKK